MLETDGVRVCFPPSNPFVVAVSTCLLWDVCDVLGEGKATSDVALWPRWRGRCHPPALTGEGAVTHLLATPTQGHVHKTKRREGLNDGATSGRTLLRLLFLAGDDRPRVDIKRNCITVWWLTWGWRAHEVRGHPPHIPSHVVGDVKLIRPCKGEGSLVVPKDPRLF